MTGRTSLISIKVPLKSGLSAELNSRSKVVDFPPLDENYAYLSKPQLSRSELGELDCTRAKKTIGLRTKGNDNVEGRRQ